MPRYRVTARQRRQFRARLALALEASELEQQEVARKIGVRKEQLTRWKSGTHYPGAQYILALARVLRVPVEWLMGG